MAKKPKTPKRKKTPAEVAQGIKGELRSIVRQWNELRQPLRTSPVPNAVDGNTMHRIVGARSSEERQDLMLRFAGSVWQLKDRVKQYVEAKGLKLQKKDASGKLVPTGIEAEADTDMNLKLCADLYNEKKHGENTNRSGHSPILSGMELHTGSSGVLAVAYDGARKIVDLLATTPDAVSWRMEIWSGDHKISFGDGLVVVTRAFNFWIPLLRQIGILDPNDGEAKPILDDLKKMEAFVATAKPFHPGSK